MLNILMTNIIFSERSGTEVATLELARSLRKRGYFPAIYSPKLGYIASHARSFGIPVTDRIERVGFVPDVIHGHHNIPLVVAMTAFRRCPAVFVCHDSSSMYDESIIQSQIKEYVAVDAACRERLIFEGVSPHQISVIPNGVALDSYRRRERWSDRPQKALLVVKKRIEHLPLVEAACKRHNIKLEVIGPGVGNIASNLPSHYSDADIVFAHSRSAIEAAATGAFVIIIDEYGYGGPLLPEQISQWPETSLSRRVLRYGVGEQELFDDVSTYSAYIARQVCDLVRERANLDRIVADWERIYDRAINLDYELPISSDRTHLTSFLERFLPSPSGVANAQIEVGRDISQAESRDRLNLLFQHFASKDCDRLPFHKGALGLVLLDHGWHPPEDTNIWSAGGIVSIWLPHILLESWKGSICFQIQKYSPVAVGNELQPPVVVSADGSEIALWDMRDQEGTPKYEQQLEIPEHLWPTFGGALRVVFEIEDAVSPKSVGQGEDQRILGISLSRISRGPG